MRVVSDLRRIDNPTRAELDGLCARNEPAILTGVITDWPALGRWSNAYLRSACGERTLSFKLRDDASRHRVSIANPRMTVASFCDRTDAPRDNEHLFLEAMFHEQLPELVPDVKIPAVLDGINATPPFFFGGQDTFSRFHYHPMGEALLCQVTGDKRIVLASPAASACFGQNRFYTPDFSTSTVVNENEFSDRKPDEIFDVVVRAGECLYIPIHWWHCAYGLGFAISITFMWMANPRRIFFPPMGLRYGLPSLLMFRATLMPLVFGKRAMPPGVFTSAAVD